MLILAHERGVHASADDGRSWLSLSPATGLPPVPTDDVAIHPRDNALVLGTHGRGIWILDDLAPLELLTPDTLARDAALAPIAPARQMVLHTPQAWFGQGMFFGPNPDFDASVYYYLRNAAAGPVQIEINDARGRLVRTLQGPSAKGINRAKWDLRADPPAQGQVADQPAGRGGRGPAAPLVPPGTYQVVLKIPGPAPRELLGEVIVEKDPIVGNANRPPGVRAASR